MLTRIVVRLGLAATFHNWIHIIVQKLLSSIIRVCVCLLVLLNSCTCMYVQDCIKEEDSFPGKRTCSFFLRVHWYKFSSLESINEICHIVFAPNFFSWNKLSYHWKEQRKIAIKISHSIICMCMHVHLYVCTYRYLCMYMYLWMCVHVCLWWVYLSLLRWLAGIGDSIMAILKNFLDTQCRGRKLDCTKPCYSIWIH